MVFVCQRWGLLHSVSCCRRVPEVWASTWQRLTPSSSMTPTGTPTTTFRSHISHRRGYLRCLRVIEAAHVVRRAGSMRRSGVCPSVCLSCQSAAASAATRLLLSVGACSRYWFAAHADCVVLIHLEPRRDKAQHRQES